MLTRAAQKLKADLIERAKLKKSYAKVLKAEGMESTRLQERKDGKRVERVERKDGEDGNGEGSKSSRFSVGSRKGKERSFGDRKRDDSRADAAPLPITAQRKRALSPSVVGPPMPLAELAALKKEAYAPRRRDAAVAGSVGGMVRSGNGGSGKRGGQPNMGAKMGLLLERIKAGK